MKTFQIPFMIMSIHHQVNLIRSFSWQQRDDTHAQLIMGTAAVCAC